MGEEIDFDVIIVGAGPAGCGLAAGLWKAGITRIALLDKPSPLPFRIGESATPEVPRLLSELGLEFDANPHRAYTRNLVSWGSDQIESNDFLFRGQGNGYHLNRSKFDDYLKESIQAKGIPIISPAWIADLAPINQAIPLESRWEFTMHNGNKIRSAVVADASGRASAFCRRLGITRNRVDSLIALACRVPNEGKLQGASFIQSSPYGWWYAVNLHDDHSLVSLMTDTPIAKSLNLHDPLHFQKVWAANPQLSQYITAPERQPAVHTFAAYTSYLPQASGKTWIAVGDALMSFDPLTSSGISGALSDAVAAVPVIAAQLRNDFGPAREYALRANGIFNRYMQERAGHYAREKRWPGEEFWRGRISHPN